MAGVVPVPGGRGGGAMIVVPVHVRAEAKRELVAATATL